MPDKFPEEDRTFETRLQFIISLFSDLFSQHDIMAHCIVHKLDWSYLQYCEELDDSLLKLTGEDPLKVLKGIK